MAIQHGLDFNRGNVLSGATDHVLLAVDEMEITIHVARDDVAGVQPSTIPGLVGSLRVLQILPEEAVARIGACAPHQELARHSHGGIISTVIDDANLNLGRRTAETTGADLARLDIGADGSAASRLG